MDFYQALSTYYDELFPVDREEMAFLVSQVAPSGRLLDIGCGTGNKTVFFSEVAERVLAFDSDAGMIVRAAHDNARPNTLYEVLDMKEIGSRFPNPSFNSALCLGNTLVHLDGTEEISRTLKAINALLLPEGVLVLQILNYDRILDREIRELPLLTSNQAEFHRSYRPDGDKLHFVTKLTVIAEGNSYDNDVLLYPLRKGELLSLLEKNGFLQPALFGDYKGTPYNDDSFVCIAVSRKA